MKSCNDRLEEIRVIHGASMGNGLWEAIGAQLKEQSAEWRALLNETTKAQEAIQERDAELARIVATAERKREVINLDYADLCRERERHAAELKAAVAAERAVSDIGVQTKIEAIQADAKREKEHHVAELAQAVAAERERNREAVNDLELEVGGLTNVCLEGRRDLEAERERHAAELAEESNTATVYLNNWNSVQSQLDESYRERGRVESELAAADQRWQERLLKAKAAAYEQAAKIADRCHTGLGAGHRIRAFAKPKRNHAETEIHATEDDCTHDFRPGAYQDPPGWTQGAAIDTAVDALTKSGQGEMIEAALANAAKSHDAPPSDKTVAPAGFDGLIRCLDPGIEFGWIVVGWKMEA